MAKEKPTTKQCKFCKSEINIKATVCPICKREQKKGHGCLITLVIIVLLGGSLCFGITQIIKNPEQYSTSHLASKYIDVTAEEGKLIDSILSECGITKIKSFERDELLDNLHFDGETGYRIALNDNVKNIILYLDSNNEVYSLRYIDYDLYFNEKVVATINDYTMSTDDASDLMIMCQEKVKDILKSPSTAKFPNILNWGFRREKNIVTISSYVDAQNGFGAEIRSTFQFTIDTSTNTIQSFVFDNQELIQQ